MVGRFISTKVVGLLLQVVVALLLCSSAVLGDVCRSESVFIPGTSPFGLGNRTSSVCSNPQRVVIAGSPGSGLAHIVYLMELVTGTPIEYNDFTPKCGWSERCDHVRQRLTGQVSIEATTFPFPDEPDKSRKEPHGDTVSDKLDRMDDLRKADCVVLLVRNAFDAYALKTVRPGLYQESDFIENWAQHVDYWTLTTTGTPTVVVRFEDVMLAPEHIIGQMVQTIGLWDRLSIDASRLKLAVKAWQNDLVMHASQTLSDPLKLSIATELAYTHKYPYLKQYVPGEKFMQLASLHRHTLGRVGYSHLLATWNDPSIKLNDFPTRLDCALKASEDVARPYRIAFAGSSSGEKRLYLIRISQDPFPLFEDQKKKRSDNDNIYEISLASVPRSGNTWTRMLLEAATGISSESVFYEEGTKPRHRTGTYSADCGEINDCDNVHPAEIGEPVVIKTHAPFLAPDLICSDPNITMDGFKCNVNYALLLVRNPLENYLAYIRYRSDVYNAHGLPERGMDRRRQMKRVISRWAGLNDFWRSYGTPLTSFRYEDLLVDTWGILGGVLQSTGLRDLVPGIDAKFAAAQMNPRLHPDKSLSSHEFFSREMYMSLEASDLRWILATHRPMLARYGYDLLYEVWLEAIEGRETDEAVTARLIERVMAATRGLGSWGEQAGVGE